MPYRVTVDQEKCTGCEKCVDTCTAEVFEIRKGKSFPVNEKSCIGCESCIGICEESAIRVKELETDLSPTLQSLLKDILCD
ncbi:MAG: indolepyruvate ferredoxin oxidoreductase subunit alpha [Thermodesulfobacteriota bacterium]